MNKQRILKHRAILAIILFAFATMLTWASQTTLNQPVELIRYKQSPIGEIPQPNIIGTQNVTFVPPPAPPISATPRLAPLSQEYIETLTSFSYLANRIFLADPETILLPSDINVHKFLETDLTIDIDTDGPQVLIFHTHSAEMFTDSNPSDPMTGVMGTGRYLAQVLAEVHGIETLHHTGRFDFIDGASHRPGSYERMEPAIRQILDQNPSIQVIIDLHRDGVGPYAPPFLRYIDGVPTAQIMFFNGLSRQNRNGQAVEIARLPNPYQQENLNFSFRLQLAANQLYPGLARRVYLRQFRYSLHMLPRSTLVEVGNQHNTQQQAKNAMYPLAGVIAAVLLGSD